jgi:HK97 family phage major capsid protein
MSDYIKVQLEERARAYEAAKDILDRAAAENRSLDAAERESVDRAFADMDKRKSIIDDIQALEARKAEVAEVVAGAPEARGVAAPIAQEMSDDQLIRSLARGEVRTANFEHRSVTKASTGAPVPTRFYDRVVELMRYTGPMLDPELVTILNTAGGENLQIPRTNTYSVGSVTAEGAVIGASDPAFQSFLTLGAYKYSFLVQVSLEMIEDSGVDILSYLGANVGQGIGFAVNNALTLGTGTVQPNGIVTSGSVAITGGTGVSGAFTYANVVDLAYSLNAAVRMMPSFRISGGATAIAALRKLTNPAGYYVFEPALQAGTPDRVLGYPLVENPHVAAVGTAAKSLIAGDFKSFYVRQVGGIRLDRSDDFAFSSGLATFRATMRVDGGLPQSTHVAVFQGGAS